MSLSDEIKEIKYSEEIVYDEDKLRVQCNDVTEDECSKLNIWEKLRVNLRKNKTGVGLAAIQIGYPIKAALAIVEGKEHRLLNPKFIEKSKDMVKLKGEGCLSFPGRYVNTVRHEYVVVEDDINGKMKYNGFLAMVVQHEIDHMEGVLFIDRMVNETYSRQSKKIGRNDPCPCGSGKKYKKCCLK